MLCTYFAAVGGAYECDASGRSRKALGSTRRAFISIRTGAVLIKIPLPTAWQTLKPRSLKSAVLLDGSTGIIESTHTQK